MSKRELKSVGDIIKAILMMMLGVVTIPLADGDATFCLVVWVVCIVCIYCNIRYIFHIRHLRYIRYLRRMKHMRRERPSV